MFKVFKRTEGVSTTEITGRLLKLVDALNNKNNSGEVSKVKKFEEILSAFKVLLLHIGSLIIFKPPSLR